MFANGKKEQIRTEVMRTIPAKPALLRGGAEIFAETQKLKIEDQMAGTIL